MILFNKYQRAIMAVPISTPVKLIGIGTAQVAMKETKIKARAS